MNFVEKTAICIFIILFFEIKLFILLIDAIEQSKLSQNHNKSPS